MARGRARYRFANEAPGWRFRDLIFDSEPEAERDLELAELNRIRGPVALMQYWDVGDLPGTSWCLLRLSFLHLKQSDPARALEVLAQLDLEHHQPRGEQARLLLVLATCLAAFDLRGPARLLLHESRAARVKEGSLRTSALPDTGNHRQVRVVPGSPHPQGHGEDRCAPS